MSQVFVSLQIFKLMKLLFTFILALGSMPAVLSQPLLPVIKANSTKADIQVGNQRYNDYWNIMPEINLDVFEVSELGVPVTFFTDLDSISVVMKKDTQLDFIILLNERDSAYTQIAYKPTRLDILKGANSYDYSQQRDLPIFTYLDSLNPDLLRIRESFALDSVAGTGNEISKLLNVMHWVHNLITHDGSSHNPDLKNAIDLVNVCKSGSRGLNCRMMATVLNECYLSMGYRSRMVTCMPKELEFQDCHVINTVYSEQLDKWIWLDSTFDAYVMDETGELLGIQDVRERLIDGRPLILNPEANWNKQMSQTKEYYLYEYMAKNLYRLESPVHATYDYETLGTGKNVISMQLLPLDGINQTPKVISNDYKPMNMSYKTYITNNPNVFWEKGR